MTELTTDSRVDRPTETHKTSRHDLKNDASRGTVARHPSSGDVAWAVALGALVLLAALPFVFMAVTSVQETMRMTATLNTADFTLDNYVRLFLENKFAQALLTSVIVVVIACVLNIVVCSMAAFAFEKNPFPGSEAVFWIYIATMMVPGQVTLIPLYGIIRDLGLLNTHLALALPVVNAFGVFLIRQFMKGIPNDLLDAARIDGATDFRIFLRIVIPLVRPVIVALAVFTFLSTWNDFLWPLVSITDAGMETVTLAAANLQGRFTTDYGLVMAGATVTFLVPLTLYVLLQRQFVEGIVSSGVKG
ncbi:carbohydrate ABC transporter permease [Brachybacterium alimentarium]|uniref:carbohydrate ABC transporter permease n=1 Tax=Brachybacterium alimentarium TaxID=47845 RepID=UPI003FCEF169